MSRIPLDTVRGRIRHYIESKASGLGDDVLEVGSRMTNANCWWINNRDLAQGKWTGMDMQPGENVDQVCSMQDMPKDWKKRFTGVLCSEVLEHVDRPWLALPKLRAVMRPGALLIVTTLFAFPEHGFPDDFYRYSRSGLKLLLTDAGFSDVQPEYAGAVDLMLDDHGEGPINRRQIPMHIFATARA